MSINVIVVEKNKKAYVKQLAGTTDSLKNEIDSGVEYIRLANDNSVVLVVTAANTDLGDMNRALYRQGSKKVEEVICGKFLIVAIDNGENVTSLNKKQIKRYMERFGVPERFEILPNGEIVSTKTEYSQKNKTDKKEKYHSKHKVLSLSAIKQSPEYKSRVHRAGKLLDNLADQMPEHLLGLLSDYVEAELEFHKFLERECFKSGLMFAKEEQTLKDVD